MTRPFQILGDLGWVGAGETRVAEAGIPFRSLASHRAQHPFEDEPHMIARMPNHDLWMTFFRDTEDNLLALMSEVPHAA